jgi:hypothetical protein
MRRLTLARIAAVACAVLISSCAFLAAQDVASGPVAYVYVSGNPSSNSQISAFSAAANGQLTAVTGSPFASTAQAIAVNKQYLFGSDFIDIYSYSIASDGALQQVSSIDALDLNPSCGGPYNLFLDRTGTTVYDVYGPCDGSDDGYEFFSLDSSTGQLSYLGTSQVTWAYYLPMSFVGNNVYAYGAQCNGDMYWSIFGFQRTSSGTLSPLNASMPTPPAKSGDFFCPNLTTTDAANHVIIPVQAVNQNFNPDGPPQLATYTADTSGNLTTQSTYLNMPATGVKNVNAIQISPSGNLLAIGGTNGLQIFHFNGSQVTYYTRLLTTGDIDQVTWDNSNHLYAISRLGGKLFVLTVTPTTFKQAPGSPYSITKPQFIAVLPTS